MAGNKKTRAKLQSFWMPFRWCFEYRTFPQKCSPWHKSDVFYAVFSCRFFSSRFSWPFKDSTLRILFTSDFHWQSNNFYGLISKLMLLLIKEEMHHSKVPLLLEKRKFFYYARFIYWCDVMLNWSRRQAFIYATKTWNLCCFTVFRKFSRKKKFYRKWMDLIWDSNNY